MFRLALPNGRAADTLRPADEFRRQPAYRNQNYQVNPVVATGGRAAEVIRQHEDYDRDGHESVLF